MTEERDASQCSGESASSASEPSDAPDEPKSGEIQSLTDFFDQMDRAAFKRALANRDANKRGPQSAVQPPRSQRR